MIGGNEAQIKPNEVTMSYSSNKRFSSALAETLSLKGTSFTQFVEPKELCINITTFGHIFDEEENISVFSGLEGDFLKSANLVKCKKTEATHYVIVCDSIAANGCIHGLKSKQWMKNGI